MNDAPGRRPDSLVLLLPKAFVVMISREYTFGQGDDCAAMFALFVIVSRTSAHKIAFALNRELSPRVKCCVVVTYC